MANKGKKPKKPPLDEAAMRERFEHAQAQLLLARVRRWIRGADVIEGFVVGVGSKWVALQRLSDRIEFDGWTLLRLKDIQAVSLDPDEECFEVKALKARGQWPPSPAALALDQPENMLASAGRDGTMICVFDEFSRPDVCWIGSIAALDEHSLALREVNTRGGWARSTRAFDPSDVTRVDLGGGYEEALHLVAGPPPAG
jgi:hypothetical protein